MKGIPVRVLFLEDVRPTARAGEIKEVKNGFARNYLIPRKLAVLATKHEIDRAEGLRKEAEARRRREASEWTEILDGIRAQPVRVIVRTGPTGRLYGSVTAAMIATELETVTGRDIDRRGIRIPHPIRVLGKYSIPVQFADGVIADIDVQVEPDVDSAARMSQARRAVVEAAAADPTFEEVLEQESEDRNESEDSEQAESDGEEEEKG
jgi:large subunit ribosomal protein L9